MLDYEGDVVEKKCQVRVFMSDIEHNRTIEVSVVVSKDEASLTSSIFHYVYNKFRFIHGDIGHLLHNDGHTSRF